MDNVPEYFHLHPQETFIMINQFSPDNQMLLLEVLGYNYHWRHLVNSNGPVWYLWYGLEQASFLHLLDILGCQAYIREKVLQTTGPLYDHHGDWSLRTCYTLLEKIGKYDPGQFNNALWTCEECLRTTNASSKALSLNITALDVSRQILVLHKIGKEHLKSIFTNSDDFRTIFKPFFYPEQIVRLLLEMLGDNHVKKLIPADIIKTEPWVYFRKDYKKYSDILNRIMKENKTSPRFLKVTKVPDVLTKHRISRRH